MSYLVTAHLWGPETGCELIASSQPEDVFDAVCARAQPRLSVSVPGAMIVWVALARKNGDHDGRAVPGYRVSVTVRLGRDMETLDDAALTWARSWIESEVSVALLELINPLTVEGVHVTTPEASPLDAL